MMIDLDDYDYDMFDLSEHYILDCVKNYGYKLGYDTFYLPYRNFSNGINYSRYVLGEYDY